MFVSRRAGDQGIKVDLGCIALMPAAKGADGTNIIDTLSLASW